MDEWEIVEEPGDWEIVEESPYNSASEQKEKWTESPLMSGVYGATSKFDKMFHGMLQPLLESGLLGKRVSGASKEVASDRKTLDKRSSDVNPWSHLFGEMGAEALMAAPTVSSGMGIVGRAAPKLSSFFKTALGSGLGYGAQGATEYADEDESRMSKGLFNAAIGSSLPAIGKALKHGFGAINTKGIANKVISDRNAIRETYKKGYNDFFKEASEKGISELSKPKIDMKPIIKNTTKNESSALKDFMKKPTLQNGHTAQSDLGKVIRRLEKINENSGLQTPQIKALEAAKAAQKRIRGAMLQGLQKAKKPELVEKYSKLTEGYKREVLPYTKNKSINKFLRKELTAPDLVRKLTREEKFGAQLLNKYPELLIRKNIPKLGKIGLGGAGLYGGKKLYDLLGDLK